MTPAASLHSDQLAKVPSAEPSSRTTATHRMHFYGTEMTVQACWEEALESTTGFLPKDFVCSDQSTIVQSQLILTLQPFAAFDADNVTHGAWAYALTRAYEGSNETAFQAAAEQLRIMVLSGPEGSKAICNRVARTVEIGAEGESMNGDDQGNGDEQGSESDGEGDSANSSTGGGDENAESGASSTYMLHSVGIAVSVVVCSLATHWL